ncbi:HEAT repeat domain-containing protein [Streptomyces sp. NPDC059567]|uniref:HEAT repeat domain-containing protein n=1 Tax=Streptomyces sp. NPDC059567 TaxID=3346867 RepID=UPI003680C58D
MSGLAERRDSEDAVLLRALTQHTDGGVRARALGGLRRLGVLGDDTLIRYADEPDPRVGAVVLRVLRNDPAALRALLGHPLARVRAGALVHLAHRHAIGWDEALPLLSDPAPEVTRAAACDALQVAGREVPATRLLALAAPGEAPERRALAMYLLGRSSGPEALLNALRLLDDPVPAVHAAARDQAQRVLWHRTAEAEPHADEIRALVERHKERLVAWHADERRRLCARTSPVSASPAPAPRRPLGRGAPSRGGGHDYCQEQANGVDGLGVSLPPSSAHSTALGRCRTKPAPDPGSLSVVLCSLAR